MPVLSTAAGMGSARSRHLAGRPTMRRRAFIVTPSGTLALMLGLAGCNENATTYPAAGPAEPVSTLPSFATITNAARQIFQAPDAQAGAAFGAAVARVGETVLVGAPQHAADGMSFAGKAYLFARDGTLLQSFQAPDVQEGGEFGAAVAVVGQNVLIGARGQTVGGMTFAGKAYLFAPDGTLLHTFQAPDAQQGARFGLSVAAVGENVLVAAPQYRINTMDLAGKAYLFAQSGTLLQTFQAPEPVGGATFGFSVAGLGEKVLIGAFFDTADGVPLAGKAYLFAQNGTLLQTFQAPVAQAIALFGASVSAVGENVLVGAPQHMVGALSGAGQAFLFSQGGTLLQTFQSPDPQAGGTFGSSLAVVGDLVLVGAAGEIVNGLSFAGQAYLFSQNGTLLQTFQAPDAQANAYFGGSVAGAGENVVIGAPQHQVEGFSAGQVYLFATELGPVESIQQILGQIDELETAGSLNPGQTEALRATLNHALRSVEQGRIEAACGQLGAFANQIRAMIRSAQLTQGEAEPLITLAMQGARSLCT